MLSMSGQISADLDYVLLHLIQFYNVFSSSELARSEWLNEIQWPEH